MPDNLDWLLDEVTTIRRHIHRNPELGHAEIDTSAYIEERLRDLGCFEIFRPAPTSIAAFIGRPGVDIVALRADLDALPRDERTDAPYKSTRPGITHACGHDGHAAALLGAARYLTHKDLPERSVLLVFQQAEETHPSGAPRVLAGLRDRFGEALDQAHFYSFHLWPDLPEHQVGIQAGSIMGSVTGVRLRLSGEPGIPHGVHAQRSGPDALDGIVRLYERLTPLRHGRLLSRDQPATLHIGEMTAGDRPQDVAATAELRGSLRAVDRAVESKAIEEIRRALNEVASYQGLDSEAVFDEKIRPPLVNDADAVARVRAACDHAMVDWVEYPVEPLGVSEDFGCYLSAGTGAYFLLGCGSNAHTYQLHDPRFDFDERVLCTAVRILTGLVTGY